MEDGQAGDGGRSYALVVLAAVLTLLITFVVLLTAQGHEVPDALLLAVGALVGALANRMSVRR